MEQENNRLASGLSTKVSTLKNVCIYCQDYQLMSFTVAPKLGPQVDQKLSNGYEVMGATSLFHGEVHICNNTRLASGIL